jgi:uncharacterized BrkB/YihY/UPF0761 family membrane protein
MTTWDELKTAGSRLYRKIFDTDVLGNFAEVAFYFSFAMFPLLFSLLAYSG